ncbi:MAG TPA: hypothetical protein VGE50_01125 [Gammaproteobacteria bacterium]
MDQELLKLLTRIKIQGKKLMGLEIDIMRLNADRHYADEILHKLTTSENEELVMTAINFMGKVGLLKTKIGTEPAVPATEPPSDPISGKYTGRLR